MCDTNGKQLWGRRVNKGFPLYGLSHKTTLWADRTTTYTQHLQPLCNTTEKQLSGPRVNKGFPYMEYHTKPLCGHTEPLRTPNTCNHCVRLVETNCEGPVLIRVSPYMEYYTKPLCEQTEPLRTPNTLNHSVTLMDNNSQGPVLIRVSPCMAYYTEPLCGQTEPLRKSNTRNQLCDTTGTQLSGPRVNKGFPLYETSHRTTSWAHKPTHNAHNHCVTQLEHNCQSPVNTPFSAPYLSGVLPPQHKQQLCGHTQPLCGLIDLKTLLENNFQGPMFISDFPSTTKKQALSGHTSFDQV